MSSLVSRYLSYRNYILIFFAQLNETNPPDYVLLQCKKRQRNLFKCTIAMSHPVYISRIRDSKRKLTHYSAKVSRYSFILFQETPCVRRAFTITLLHSKMGSKSKIHNEERNTSCTCRLYRYEGIRFTRVRDECKKRNLYDT